MRLSGTVLLFVLLTPGLVGAGPIDRESLRELRFDAETSRSGDDDSRERIEAMRRTARTVGAQHGYAVTMERFRETFEENEGIFEHYDFGTLMRLSYAGSANVYLLPAAVTQINDKVDLSSSLEMLRTTKETYVVQRPARLVTRPPTWRQYLFTQRSARVGRPAERLLPRNREEEAIWKAAIDEGWESGESQAVREMNGRMRVMHDDFTGTVRFLRLVQQGMAELPTVATTGRGIGGNQRELIMDERVYRITSGGRLVPDTDAWNEGSTDNRESLRYPAELDRMIDQRMGR